MKVLFFGYDGCEHSKDAYNYLKQFGCELTAVWSSSRKDKIPEEIFSWQGDYIFSFLNYLILPSKLLRRARYSINFHPASPQHPGSGVSSWAIYDGSKDYGVTAHLINEKIDDGDILMVKRFPILESDNATSLLSRAKKFCLILFYELIEKLFIDKITIEALIGINEESWIGEARKIKEVDAMSEISVDIDSQELEKRIRAFHTERFPVHIYLHGRKFIHV
jgi:methionyl-tRNA formyltransferase|tara:strand:+ start:9979 stop:10641 length:663 start_codon:yes stop_codon:yes gene_type:complete